MPSRRFCELAACAAVLLAGPSAARAVIFHSTGDPNFNTTAPTGSLANSGWQYQVNIAGSFLGTPVGPNHFLTATHIGGTGAFYHDGTLYTPTAVVADYGDLRLIRVDHTFHSYAPLYESTDGNEVGKSAVIIGRGTQRGSVNTAGGVTRGWNWGTSDQVRRWGENVISATAKSGSLLRFDFDLNANPNEAVLSEGDSGGAVFINVNGQWKLAGINSSVTGPYSVGTGGAQFVAALYNTSGLYNHETNANASGPSGGYASRVSSSAASIKSFLNLPPTWKTNGSGSWGTSGNWANGGVPNAVGAVADFRTAITAARTVTYSGTVTAGTLNFDSAHGYSIVPSVSSDQLRLNVASGSAQVNVASGSHSITQLRLDDPTVFNVIQGSSTLTLNNMAATSQPMTKQGQGRLQVNRLTSGAVTISQGTVALNPGGSATGKVSSLSLASGAGAKLDLAKNNLVVASTSVGTKSGSNYTGLTGLIAQGRGNGSWNGSGGITSSAAAATDGLTTLGIARAADALSFGNASTMTWRGQTVSANDALIAYTYAGDANLDGLISGDDYVLIDFSIAQAGASGYYNGDFNYDGMISGDDYTIIDFNIARQGAALNAAMLQSSSSTMVSAVPEPGALSLVLIGSAALLARRRRRRQRGGDLPPRERR